MSIALVEVRSVSKSFAGVRALKDVSFQLLSGEVHALVGENGAGKSTLTKIITGAIEADSGTLEIRGSPVLCNNPRVARSLGIAAIYQQPALFPHLSVAENIAFALEDRNVWRRVNWTRRNRRAVELTGASRSVDRPGAAGFVAEHAGAADRRDREGDRCRREDPDHGRAHGIADGSRSG